MASTFPAPIPTKHVARIDAGIAALSQPQINVLARTYRTARAKAAAALRDIEPWYDWGRIDTFNIDAQTDDDIVEGEVRYAELQWLGFHVVLQFGRSPEREV